MLGQTSAVYLVTRDGGSPRYDNVTFVVTREEREGERRGWETE